MSIVNKIKGIFSFYSKVFENYFFMTLLTCSSSLIGLLIYPFLITRLGGATYGLYVFALSIVSYFTIFVSFGFNYQGVKKIVEHRDDLEVKNEIVSSIFTAKFLLALIATILFIPLLLFVPKICDNRLIFIICYVQILSELLFPIWYFQAVQKMRIVTYIQLTFRVLTIPFILLLIKTPDDLWIYALIVTASIVLGALTSQVFLWKKEGIFMRFVPVRKLKSYYQDALPFFWSSSAGVIKQESVTLIIGFFFGMRDVALYDLANKIVLIPRLLTNSINNALFPSVIERNNKSEIKKIIRYETWLGLFVMLVIALGGYWVILLMGGRDMLLSYPLALIQSTSILTWLVVGCYINFIFIPQNHYYFVTRNQLVAFFSFFFFCITGLLIYKSIVIVVLALSLSGFCEIIYCRYLIKKYSLL